MRFLEHESDTLAKIGNSIHGKRNSESFFFFLLQKRNAHRGPSVGGRPLDKSVLSAALRETWEEAGLHAHQLRVLPA